jgi:fumarate hydratase class II
LVKVRVELPLAVRVAGENAAVQPAGKPVAVRLTVIAPVIATAMVDVAVPVAKQMFTEVGFGVKVKPVHGA